MIKILIVDDHPMVRDGIRAMLQSPKNQQAFMIDEADNGEEAVNKVKMGDHDIALVDYRMPGMPGDEIIENMLFYKPKLKILSVSHYDQAGYIKKMMSSGAKGYVIKNIEPSELLKAIRTILEDKTYYSVEVAMELLKDSEDKQKVNGKSNKFGLTRRELEILGWIAKEKTSEEIAEILFVSKRTVDTHRLRILTKVHARNTAGLIKAAYELNLIE